MTLSPDAWISKPAAVAVIGAGGAGLLAGIAAARAGVRTVLYERNAKPARKVAISGGGRCNFSNTLDARRFVKLFGDDHAKLLGHALRALSNADLRAMLARGFEGRIRMLSAPRLTAADWLFLALGILISLAPLAGTP